MLSLCEPTIPSPCLPLRGEGAAPVGALGREEIRLERGPLAGGSSGEELLSLSAADRYDSCERAALRGATRGSGEGLLLLSRPLYSCLGIVDRVLRRAGEEDPWLGFCERDGRVEIKPSGVLLLLPLALSLLASKLVFELVYCMDALRFKPATEGLPAAEAEDVPRSEAGLLSGTACSVAAVIPASLPPLLFSLLSSTLLELCSALDALRLRPPTPEGLLSPPADVPRVVEAVFLRGTAPAAAPASLPVLAFPGALPSASRERLSAARGIDNSGG